MADDGDHHFDDDQPHQQDDDQPQQYDDVDDGGSGDGGAPGGGPTSDEDEDAEDAVPAFLPADHRLMAPVQAALKRELTQRDERVSLAMRERETTLLAIKKAREELGVELYSTQQGLAKLQLELEKRHEKFERSAATRQQQEVQLKQALETYQRTCAMRDELEKKRSASTRHAKPAHKHCGACMLRR
jgi:hypothetical protein